MKKKIVLVEEDKRAEVKQHAPSSAVRQSVIPFDEFVESIDGALSKPKQNPQ